MKAIILAAGKGSRIQAMGHDAPKCLLRIAGKSALERLYDTVIRSGLVDTCYIVGGYRIERLRETLPSNCVLMENDRYESTNSLFSLWMALKELDEEGFVVFNSDVVYDSDLLTRFLHHHRQTACLIDELAVDDSSEYFFRVEDGLIRGFQKGRSTTGIFGQDTQAFKVSGEHLPLFKRRVEELLENGGLGYYAGNALGVLIEEGLLHPVFTNGDVWLEYDTPDEYEHCDCTFRQLDANPQKLSIYGIKEQKGSGEQTKQVNSSWTWESLKALAGRGVDCARERRLPSKLKWLHVLAEALVDSPAIALSHSISLAKGRMSIQSFRLQVYGRVLLSMVYEECQNMDLKPFLAWGTLLGHVRDGQFIPSDFDIDVGMNATDFVHVEELKARMLSRGCTIRRQATNKISFFHPSIPGLWLDIDLFVEADEMAWNRTVVEEGQSYGYYFPRRLLGEIVPAVFEGVDVYVPQHPEDFLEYVYGNWRIPESKKEIIRGPLNYLVISKN